MGTDKFPECVKCLNWGSSRTVLPCAMCEQANKFEPEKWPASEKKVEAKPAAVSPSASAMLTVAAEIMDSRGKQYDQPAGERSMGRAVAALNIILNRQALTESEGWLLLQLLKDVRDRTTVEPHADSLVDCVSYAALKAEARLAGK